MGRISPHEPRQNRRGNSAGRLLSDSGITAVSTGEAVQFAWTASPSTQHSALSSITGPDGHRVVYTYDQQGNLVSARDLLTGDTARYGCDAQHRLTLVTSSSKPGSVITYPDNLSRFTMNVERITSDLGAAITYLQNSYSGTLAAGATDQLVFSVRPSEVSSTNSGDIYIGVIIEADAGSNFAPAIPLAPSLVPLATSVTGNKAFALFRIEKEGLELLKIAGANGSTSGAYSVKLFIAGDANRDTKIDGTDSQLIEASLGAVAGSANYSSNLDANQDGRIDTSDLHLYRQNLGFIPNQAPTATHATATTHQDLELLFPVEVSHSAPSTQHSAPISSTGVLTGITDGATGVITASTTHGPSEYREDFPSPPRHRCGWRGGETEIVLKIRNPDDMVALVIAFDGAVNRAVIAGPTDLRSHDPEYRSRSMDIYSSNPLPGRERGG